MANKNSRQYWIDREIEHAKTVLKDDMKIVRKMESLYRDASREIEKEVTTMLSNYAERNNLTMTEVRKRVNATDIRDFEEKAERYVREKNFSDKANREMAIYNLKMKVSRLELLIMHIDLELIALTDGLEKLVFERTVTVGREELKRQAGILQMQLDIDRTEIEYIAKNKFHGDDFSERLWTNKALLHDELEKRLSQAILQGQNPRVAARLLRKKINQNIFNSERLLITETARVQSEVQLESFKESQYEQYEFIATEGACEICKKLDGQIFDVIVAQPGVNIAPMHPFVNARQRHTLIEMNGINP